MSDAKVGLYAKSGNWAVVQMPGRRFPAIAFQGDTLASLCQEAGKVYEAARNTGNEEAIDEAKAFCDRIVSMLGFYEETLREKGLDLPFTEEMYQRLRQMVDNED